MSTAAPQSHWKIGAISTPRLHWGAVRGNHIHCCPTCGIPLLTSETPGFCCGPAGSKFHDVPPLPDLPAEYSTFIYNPNISSLSRILNLVFSFASMETTQQFPTPPGGHAFVSIQGKVYHRIRPNHHDSAIRWLLHDGFLQHLPPHQITSEARVLAYVKITNCHFFCMVSVSHYQRQKVPITQLSLL